MASNRYIPASESSSSECFWEGSKTGLAALSLAGVLIQCSTLHFDRKDGFLAPNPKAFCGLSAPRYSATYVTVGSLFFPPCTLRPRNTFLATHMYLN